ncbi:MAG: cation:proton antiporter [Sulfuricella sp.]|nr:cation:proton antiporter [Sulfuricella sp.]
MTDFSFLPTFPLPVNSFVLFGVLLLTGLLGGHLAGRTRLLPRITGYIAVGLLLGPGGLNLLSPELLDDARLFVDISLGLILFELGRRLDLGWLRRDRWFLSAAVAESAVSFGLIWFALTHFGIEPLQAAMAAAIGIATSPAVVLLVAHDLKADGPVTRRALSLVALNNIIALLLFTALLPVLHFNLRASWPTILLHPLYRLAGSLVLGYLAYLVTARMARLVGKQEGGQFILLVGMIVVAVGCAKLFNLSVMLTLLGFGVMAKNLDRKRDIMAVEFGYAGQLFFVVLFVVTGASLELYRLGAAPWAVLAFVAARFIGKSATLMIFGRPSGLSHRQAAMLGIALVPMAEVAIGMARTVTDIYPEFGANLAVIVVSSVAVLDLIGPVAAQLAFKWAGEASPERVAKKEGLS